MTSSTKVVGRNIQQVLVMCDDKKLVWMGLAFVHAYAREFRYDMRYHESPTVGQYITLEKRDARKDSR